MSENFQPAEPLGPGAIIGQALGLVFGNLPVVIGIAVVPSLISVAVMIVTQGTAALNMSLAITDPTAAAAANANTSTIAGIIGTVLSLLVWLFLGVAMTRAVRQIGDNGQAGLPECMKTGLRLMLPVIPVMIVFGVVVYLGLIFLILPGLYVMAMWWLILPIAVFEGLRLSALGRSADLTRGYRWPMVGLVCLYLLLYVVAIGVLGVVQFAVAGFGTAGLIVAGIVSIAFTAFSTAVGAAIAVLAYSRLCEIKEGSGSGSLAEVFR